MGVHGLIFWPIFAKFQCAFVLLEKMKNNYNMVQKTHKCCFSYNFVIVQLFFGIKKEAPWNLAKISPNESPWTPIFDHLVQFWITSVPKQPPLKLKSGGCQIRQFSIFVFFSVCDCVALNSDFNLSGGCFGTDIIQNCTKWSNIGVHGLSFGPIFAKFHCASFLLRKNQKKWQYGRKEHKNVVFGGN